MFYSSRNFALKCDFREAILSPLASDGGLFCPSNLRPLSAAKLRELEDKFALECDALTACTSAAAATPAMISKSTYNAVATAVCEAFGLAEFAPAVLRALSAYEEFDAASALHFKSVLDRQIIELFHGKTRAFKDLALAPLARLSAELAGSEQLLICCATSGDTGPATLRAFSPFARVVCIFPEGKTSATQRAQMANLAYANSLVLGICGNFDDAQSALKNLLNDAAFCAKISAKNLRLGAANSLNFGRILFQTIYHFAASLRSPNARVVVPSGNFGNALAAIYARILGAKISEVKVVCNENRLLADFFASGAYDLRERAFKSTASPAMDILRPSNLERLIALRLGCERTKECYESLAASAQFALNNAELAALSEGISFASVSDATCLQTIREVYEATRVLIDPHTACAFAASEPGDVVCATAEWVKFAPTIARALNRAVPQNPAEEAKFLSELSEQLAAGHSAAELAGLINREEDFSTQCAAAEISDEVLKWL